MCDVAGFIVPECPYPNQYSEEFRTRTGDHLLIRPIRAEDEPKMVAFHRKLSDRSVSFRYLAGLSYHHRTAHHRLIRLCAIDYDLDMALVAELIDTGGAAVEIFWAGWLLVKTRKVG